MLFFLFWPLAKKEKKILKDKQNIHIRYATYRKLQAKAKEVMILYHSSSNFYLLQANIRKPNVQGMLTPILLGRSGLAFLPLHLIPLVPHLSPFFFPHSESECFSKMISFLKRLFHV